MNAEGRWQGQADPPLSGRGRAQAERLAKTLVEARPGAVIERLVTSDLRRAAETARALADALGIAPESRVDLRETDVGAWSGLLHSEIEARFPGALARWRSGGERVRPGGGESRATVRARAVAALAALTSGSGGAVAVVTHLGVMRCLRPALELGHAEFFWWRGAVPGRTGGAATGEEGAL